MSAYIKRRERWGLAAKRINAVNDMNGWERPTMENLPVKIMMVVTELEEAREATINPSADPLSEELADTAVRLLHILESIWPDEWCLRERGSRLSVYQSIETSLWTVLTPLCHAVEYWRKAKTADVLVCLEYALERTRVMARTLRYDLLTDVQNKTEKNAKRGHLHGKARPVG